MRKSLKKRLGVTASLGLGLTLMVAGTNAFAQATPVTECQTTVSNHMDQFYDVAKTHYAAEALEALYNMGVAKGCSSTHFCATCSIQRQAAAVFIYRLKYNSKADLSSIPPFTDLPTDTSSEVYKAIVTLYNKGVINGTGGSQFNPTGYLKRSEAATMLSKAYFTSSQISTAKSYSQSFSDVSPSSWYYEYVQTLAHQCIVNGTGGGSYYPDYYMTRIDFVLALARAHEVINRCTTGTCIESLGICGDCDPSSFSITCHGDSVRSCVNGTYKDDYCPEGCNNNKCNECKPSDPAKCISESQLQSCINYTITQNVCPASTPYCFDGACHECKGNTKSCEGDIVVACENGTINKQDCTVYNMKCDTDHCVSVTVEDCTSGQFMCESDGSRKSCEGGQWILSPCPSGQTCQGSTCVDVVAPPAETCTQGASRCDTSGNREICDNNGNWVPNACPTGQICSGNDCANVEAPTTCTENDTVCDSSGERMRCSSGQWISAPCDANQKCSGKDCVNIGASDPDCTENDVRCIGNNHQVCSSGKWQDDPCQPNQVCSGKQCMNVGECQDGEFKCDENQDRLKCSGGKWEANPCAEGLICIDNDCAIKPECTNNDTKCDGKIRMVCKDGKWKNDPCNDGKVCKGTGKCVVDDGTSDDDDDDPTSPTSAGIISTDSGCSQGNGNGAPLPLALMMLAGAGLLIRRRRHSA